MSDVPVKVKIEATIDLRDLLVLPGQSLTIHLRGDAGDVVVRLGVTERGEVEVVREERRAS